MRKKKRLNDCRLYVLFALICKQVKKFLHRKRKKKSQEQRENNRKNRAVDEDNLYITCELWKHKNIYVQNIKK